MLLVAVGAVLVGLAAGFAFASYQLNRIRRFVAGTTESYPIARLATLHHDAGGQTFSRAVEIAGRVAPAASSVPAADIGDVHGVWHRRAVTRAVLAGDDPPEVVSESRSDEPFTVDDGTGRVLVDPRGSEPFGVPKVVDRRDPETENRHEEWALPVGIRVSVRGEASDRGGRLVVHKPSDGSVFVIAAESQDGPAKVLDSAFRHRLPLCVTMGLVGAALIVVGLAIG